MTSVSSAVFAAPTATRLLLLGWRKYANVDVQHCRQALHDADFIMGGQVDRLVQ